jgi:hypothetical protein
MASKRKANPARTAPVTRKIQAEVRAAGKRVNALMAQARKAEAAARATTLRQIRMLQQQQAVAQRTLSKLGRQSAAASAPILAGLQKAWRDVEVAMRQGAKRFRDTV